MVRSHYHSLERGHPAATRRRLLTTMPTTLLPPTPQQRQAEQLRPNGAIVMHQRWENLLFLHWRWDIAAIQRTLPAGLSVDVHDGAAWLGLMPVFMRNVRPRFVPAVRYVSDFLELNLRT